MCPGWLSKWKLREASGQAGTEVSPCSPRPIVAPDTVSRTADAEQAEQKDTYGNTVGPYQSYAGVDREAREKSRY